MSNLDAFKKLVARSNDIPKDLLLLFEATESGDDGPFEEIELTSLLPGEEDEMNDLSSLTPEEMKDVDIQCNLEAVSQVVRLARFVAKDEESNLYGYWLGTESKTLSTASILMLDNEGQFRILPGGSLVEAFCGNYACDDDDTFAELKEQFEAIGIKFRAASCDGLYDIAPADEDEPKDMHHAIYNAERAKRGLPPV
jgi:hypothetical protein